MLYLPACVPVSEEFHAYVIDQLSAVAPVRTRRMFGGLGVYAGDVFFAIADDDVLYFKVDDATRPGFEAAGSRPFQPFEGAAEMTGYWNVPADVLENTDELAIWMRNAVAVATRAKGKKASKKR